MSGENSMKDSLKNFIEYLGSDEELMYYVRINVEWNEESFIRMKHLVREVIRDYENEDFYPKIFVQYFMREIPSVINILSHFKGCSEKELSAGYTKETYLSMIAERIKQLKNLHWEFVKSLTDPETKYITEKIREKLYK